jgi:adenylate cyclase
MINRKLIYSILRQTVIWGVIFSAWAILRNYGLDINYRVEQPNLRQWLYILLVCAIGAGLLFGTISYILEFKLRKLPFGLLSLIGTVSYLISILIIMTMAARAFTRVLDLEFSSDTIKTFLFSVQGAMFIIYCFIMGFFVDVFKEINKKFGPGNLMRMIRGEFYRPKEDERIVMFLDLKSSTTYAEQLGHLRFSRLIQDCFSELHVIFPYKAQVYQYVGDEVVLTWSMKEGLENGNCLRAFFAFINQFRIRSEYYMREYGFVPEFKAGINGGKITVAEVGEIKRDIAYHGDVLNTASRVQGKCNELGEKILITGNVMKDLEGKTPFKKKEVGRINLRGKSSDLLVYTVENETTG